MKVVLINPCQPYLLEHHTQAPLGLLYLSSILKGMGHDVDVSVVDLSAYSVEDAIRGVPEADIYGYTATSLDYPICVSLMRGLRQRFPPACHIIGGAHPTALPVRVWRDGFDSVFIGEAEITIQQFIIDYEERIPRPIYARQGFVNVDALPRPDRDALSWVGGRVLAVGNERSVGIMASRGCPFNCAFCASELMWQRKLRWRRVDDVITEMMECIDQYGVSVFRFVDDNMTSSKKWTREFCEKVAPLGVTWQVNIRVDSVTPDLLVTMRKAGCLEVGFGVESFDPDVLRALNKQATPEQAEAAIRMAHDAGIGCWVLLMISTPGETYGRTPELNLDAFERLRGQYRFLSCKTMIPLPGTPVWDRPEEFGIRILTRDLNKFNQYIYRKASAGGKECVVWSPIEIDGMTRDQQLENIRLMVEHTEAFGGGR